MDSLFELGDDGVGLLVVGFVGLDSGEGFGLADSFTFDANGGGICLGAVAPAGTSASAIDPSVHVEVAFAVDYFPSHIFSHL